jgi:hypothetical protein
MRGLHAEWPGDLSAPLRKAEWVLPRAYFARK